MAYIAEIVEIVAPNEAVAGSQVNIFARIKNKYSSTVGLMVGGRIYYNGSYHDIIDWALDKYNTPAGYTTDFPGNFIMPNSNVTIYIYSYYYSSEGGYVPDDEDTKNVNLAAIVTEFSELKVTSYNRT